MIKWMKANLIKLFKRNTDKSGVPAEVANAFVDWAEESSAQPEPPLSSYSYQFVYEQKKPKAKKKQTKKSVPNGKFGSQKKASPKKTKTTKAKSKTKTKKG